MEHTSTPVASFDAQLQGKAPGLQINSNAGVPGDGIFVRVRGTTSINADNNPLYIIDGVFVNTFPAYPVLVTKGWIEIRGIAWSGRGRISRVEVSTNAGRTWVVARLEIMSRAIDDTGYTQPTLNQLITARGKDMGGYHLNPVTAWRIRRDGSVLFRPENWK